MLKNAIMDVICKYLYFNKLQKAKEKVLSWTSKGR